jgi:tripartite-type tricarboxylate transporter receptor subunit TctC
MQMPKLGAPMILSAALLLAPAVASAQSAEEFYRGKTINVIASTGPGDGIDNAARMMSRFLVNHLPGKPLLVNKNMPGAGHVLAANYLANEAPRDGTTILVTLGAIVLHQMLDGRGTRYDVNQFRWIGSIDTGNQTFYLWSTSPVKTVEQARQREVLMGGTGAGSYTILYPTLMNNLAGTKFKIVAGYPNANEVHLAMQRGEVEGRAGNHYSSLKAVNGDWIRDKKITMLLQIGLERDAEMPDVPLMTDFALSPENKRVMQIFEQETAVGQTVLTAPGVPEDRLALLRKAFDATMIDPDFIAEAKKAKLDVQPAPGAKVQKIVADMTGAPPDLIAKAQAAMGDQGVIGAGQRAPAPK